MSAVIVAVAGFFKFNTLTLEQFLSKKKAAELSYRNHSPRQHCEDIFWSEAVPGDLVFYPNDTHIGIIVGKDSDGELVVVHCAGGYNNVVATGAEGFVSAGRVKGLQ